jgi:hypothetical protein
MHMHQELQKLFPGATVREQVKREYDNQLPATTERREARRGGQPADKPLTIIPDILISVPGSQGRGKTFVVDCKYYQTARIDIDQVFEGGR